MLRGRCSCANSEHPQTLSLRLVFALLPANSFVSRSYAPFARKSNHSRTYAKQGWWGWVTQW